MKTSIKKYSFFVFLFLVIVELVILSLIPYSKNFNSLNSLNQKSTSALTSSIYNNNKIDIKTNLSEHPDFKNGTLFLLPGEDNFTNIKIENASELENICISVSNPNIVKTNFLDKNIIKLTGLKIGNTKLIVQADYANNLEISLHVGKVIPSNILGETEGIIATTNGVYNYKHEKIGNDNFNKLTKDDLWAISNYFVVTKYGIYTTWNQPIAKQYWNQMKKSDFIWVNGYFLILKQGIFNTQDQQTSEECWNENSSRDDILASSTSILVLSNYVITYQGGQALQTNKLSWKITSNDIYDISDTMVATSAGVFSSSWNLFKDNLKDLKRDEFIGISKTFLVTTRGVFLYDGKEFVLNNYTYYLKNLSKDQVIAVNSNFFITTQMIVTWDYNFSFINLTRDDYIDSSSHWIITKKGIFYYSYGNLRKISLLSDEYKNIDRSDLLCITDSIFITKTAAYGYDAVQNIHQTHYLSLRSKDDIYNSSTINVFTSEGIINQKGSSVEKYPDFSMIRQNEIIQTPKDDGIYWPLNKNTGFDEQKIWSNSLGIDKSTIFTTEKGILFLNDINSDAQLNPLFNNPNPNWDNESYLLPSKQNNKNLYVGIWVGIITSVAVISISLLALCTWISHRKNRKINVLTYKKIDRLEKYTILMFKNLTRNLQTKKPTPILISKSNNSNVKYKKPVLKPTPFIKTQNIKIKKPVKFFDNKTQTQA
ncbi:hypothetical protein [Mycoplasmoides pirum]|uniref:hypothetical protein n=1 Tax=Mycoplasmoides pirum TaxID=2122 RepID=UPI000486CC76|nr:hypothetical protein [Mycoplasmoides pirum]